MIHLATYADEKMTISKEKCVLSAINNGVDICYEGSIDDVFFQFNKDILTKERGAGYWLWKPYLIYSAMSYMSDGEVLIYSDAGVEFIAPVQEIINRMDEDIFFFTNGFPHVEWCKGDVLKAITPEHAANRELKQVQASVIFFKVNQKTRDFVKEWLFYCQMPGFIDDSPSKTPNYPTFAEHRHDQAILTCLQIKYNYKLHWWPTQYSNHLPRTAEDSYPVMFRHHRKRNSEW